MLLSKKYIFSELQQRIVAEIGNTQVKYLKFVLKYSTLVNVLGYFPPLIIISLYSFINMLSPPSLPVHLLFNHRSHRGLPIRLKLLLWVCCAVANGSRRSRCVQQKLHELLEECKQTYWQHSAGKFEKWESNWLFLLSCLRKIIAICSQWEHKRKPSLFFVPYVNKETAEAQT